MDTVGEELRSEVESLETLNQVLSWALGRTPPALFVDVVAQDEFTQDVVVQVVGDRHVVFGSS